MLDCKSYIVSEGDKTVATFLSGNYHSGGRYFVVTIGELQVVVKKKGIYYLRGNYTIFNRKTNQQIGTFKYKSALFGRLLGILNTNKEYRMSQYGVSKLFKPSTWKQVWLRLTDNSTTIDYFGEIDSFTFKGRIELYGSDKLLEAMLGLCMIDEKCRADEENPA